MTARIPIMVRVLPAQASKLEVIAGEMAADAGVEAGQPPFWKGDGSVNTSEVIRRLLARADDRLREP